MTTGEAPAHQQITLEKRHGNVFVITLTGRPNKANVFGLAQIQRMNDLLDQVESSLTSQENDGGPCSLIIIGSGKFFSAGFDLKALTGKSLSEQQQKNTGGTATATNPQNGQAKNNPTTPQGQELVNHSWNMLARLLIFPVPTIAVINGHAYGLGFFLALACDHRIMMETPKKYLCLPEITIGLPLGSGFAALAKCKLPQRALKDAALTGKQWTYSQAKEHGMIDATVAATPNVPTEAFQLAKQLASTSSKGNLSTIKHEIYKETYEALTIHARSKL